MYEHLRQPWDFVSGGKGSGMHITYDGGDTWKKITRQRRIAKRRIRKNGYS